MYYAIFLCFMDNLFLFLSSEYSVNFFTQDFKSFYAWLHNPLKILFLKRFNSNSMPFGTKRTRLITWQNSFLTDWTFDRLRQHLADIFHCSRTRTYSVINLVDIFYYPYYPWYLYQMVGKYTMYTSGQVFWSG